MQITNAFLRICQDAVELEAIVSSARSKVMWQVHAAFRLGGYRTAEIDMTPALGILSIVAVAFLIIQNS
jgi:hypothetical protein